mmetsp:Transcript_27849/g.44593  ORF Transcript_27849/g.44593 Transcript_27849/m.44593 type:complete len:485 (-) Transcript_27849:1930-3384(-)
MNKVDVVDGHENQAPGVVPLGGSFVKREWRPYDVVTVPASAPANGKMATALGDWCRIRWIMMYPFQRRVLVLAGVSFTIGELLITLLALAGTAIGMYATWYPSSSGSGKGRRLDDDDDKLEASGSIPSILMALTFATACKNSIFTFLLGLPFERALFWHKLFAWLAVISGGFHGYLAIRDEGFDGDDEFLSGYILQGALIGLIVSSFYPIRRLLFEVFYYIHIILFVVAVISGLMHGASIFLIGAGLWLLDLLYRMCFVTAIYHPHKCTLEQLPADIVRISWSKVHNGKIFDYEPGQYVFICIPELGLHEWHPFSLSSSPHHEGVSVHARSLGNWTKRLHALAGTKSQVKVFVDGPYGQPCCDIWSGRYTRFLMISAGIGITPLQSITNTLLYQHTQGRPLDQLKFIWTVCDREMVDSLSLQQPGTFAGHLPSVFSPDMLDRHSQIEEGDVQADPFTPEFFFDKVFQRHIVATSSPGKSDAGST